MNIQAWSGNLQADKDYLLVDGCDTVAKLFIHRCRQYGPRTAHREKDFGIWKSYSWDDYHNHAQWIGLGLVKLGMKPGDVVSILSEDNKEWMYADLGVVCARGIPNGVYTTDSANQLAFLVNDSGSKFLIVENDEQLDKFLEARQQMPGLKMVIVIDRDGLRGFSDKKVMFLDDLYELGREEARRDPELFEKLANQVKPDDIRTLIYTSGTTGKPKGAMVSHSNVMFQHNSLFEIVEAHDTDEQLCFLPLCHVLERLFSTDSQIGVGSTINFAESPETVFENMQEVSPHIFTAVPRLWEKIYSRLQIARKEATVIGRWAFDRAIEAGMKRAEFAQVGEPVPTAIEMRYRIWDFLVLNNLRRMIGMDRMRRAGTGAAPISPDLLRWFWAIGVPLFEGFGQTETTGVVSINTFGSNKIGTIGTCIPGVEARIGDDGEIQTRGPHVFKGYWNDPKKTADAMTDDGWLRTGDVGRVDNQGFLTITGRIKDIIITAGGKNITPAEIESALKFSPYISDAVVIGDRRKYLTCLIMIDQENVENYAQEHRVPFGDFASLCAAPEVVDLIRGEIDTVNREFARVEQIKDFRLIDVLLTAEDDELTPTMKLKRSFVEEKHAPLIKTMYTSP